MSASPTPTPPTARAVSEVLEAAADLLTPDGAWTQGAFARLASGRMTWTGNPEAVCFCLRGALVRVGGVAVADETIPATRTLGFRSATRMVYWNDAPERTQAEVVAALRSAATLARETEAGS